MFFKSILQVITVAAVAFTGLHAVPIESESEIVARNATTIAEPSAALADGHLFVCANAIFAQPCNNFEFTINQCINFSSPYDNSISSVGPDSGFVCIVYKDRDCTGDALAFVSPGVGNLLNTGFNDNISSFKCVRA